MHIITSTPKLIRCACKHVFLLSYVASALLMANTITVDYQYDASPSLVDGNCTLREAIEAAETNAVVDSCNAGNGADIIDFDSSISGSGIILEDDLSNYLNPITQSLTIVGPGTDLLNIDGDDNHQIFYFDSPADNQIFRLSGINLFQGMADGASLNEQRGGVIHVRPGETVVLEDMRFESSAADNGGGAIYTETSSNGPAISVMIKRSTFTNNRAKGATGGGAIRAGIGTSLSIIDSTFNFNHAEAANSNGGAINISNQQTGAVAALNVLRSTFTENTADRNGGAIYAGTANLSVSIQHSTLVKNIAGAAAGVSGEGGGLHANGVDLTIRNTIIANNQDNSTNVYINKDIALNSVTLDATGFNYIGNQTGAIPEFPDGSPNGNNDYVGVNGAELNPDLDVLGDYGGPTWTHWPMPGGANAVVDKGSCTGEPHDQRLLGNDTTKVRIVDVDTVTNGAGSDGCDIGAVEAQAQIITPAKEACFVIKASNGNTSVICF